MATHPAADRIREWLLTHAEPTGIGAAGRAAWAAESAAGLTAALGAAGLLSVAHSRAEDAARWLADQSRNPRYTDGDGWRLLLSSEPDVLVALSCAERQTGVSRHSLADARTVLLRHLTSAGG